MRFTKLGLPLAIGAIMAVSCEKDGSETKQTYYRGVYVVNEGSFMANNGSISFFDPEEGRIINGVFETANQRPLGDVVQSFAVVQDTTGYIVVNGSGKLEIVSLRDFKARTAPVPVDYPRYFMQVDGNKGYLTAGSMEGSVYVFSLSERTVTDTIAVGKGPEGMIKTGNKVIIANSGGWDADSTLTVIDVTTDQVTDQIAVPKIPIDMALDGAGKLWVYCKGLATYSWDPPYNLISQTDAIIVRINPADGNKEIELHVGLAGDFTATPPRLAISRSGDKLYYLRPEGVYMINTTSPMKPDFPIIWGSFYGIEAGASDDMIYLFGGSFAGNGTMQVYDQSGTLRGEGTVGIAPNGATFNTY